MLISKIYMVPNKNLSAYIKLNFCNSPKKSRLIFDLLRRSKFVHFIHFNTWVIIWKSRYLNIKVLSHVCKRCILWHDWCSIFTSLFPSINFCTTIVDWSVDHYDFLKFCYNPRWFNDCNSYSMTPSMCHESNFTDDAKTL
jgi:hypothetical protein